MRAITRQSVAAFMQGVAFKSQNMAVEVQPGATNDPALKSVVLMRLHGNIISFRYIYKDHEELWITSAGWRTNTTKERLNGLPGVSIGQKAWHWYLNGKAWDGELIKII